MSLRHTPTLHCNTCAAFMPGSARHRNGTELRRAAAALGWTTHHGKDHCPACTARRPRAGKRARGLCGGCERDLPMTLRGVVMKHQGKGTGLGTFAGWCPGGGQKPTRVTHEGRPYRPAPMSPRAGTLAAAANTDQREGVSA